MSNIQIQNQSQDDGISENDGDDEQKGVNILYQDIEKQQFLEILQHSFDKIIEAMPPPVGKSLL